MMYTNETNKQTENLVNERKMEIGKSGDKDNDNGFSSGERSMNTEFLTLTKAVKNISDQNGELCMLFEVTGHLDKFQTLTRCDKIKAEISKLKQICYHL